MSTEKTILTDDDYAEKLKDADGVLIFFKKLCPACKALTKMLDKFFAANPGISFLGIDSEESPETVKVYGIEKIPTLLIFKGGEVTARKAGLMNLNAMTDFYKSSQI